LKVLDEKGETVKIRKKDILLSILCEIRKEITQTREYMDSLTRKPNPEITFKKFEMKLNENNPNLVDFDFDIGDDNLAKGTMNFWSYIDLMDNLRTLFYKNQIKKEEAKNENQ